MIYADDGFFRSFYVDDEMFRQIQVLVMRQAGFYNSVHSPSQPEYTN
jgi:hypothetical protein